MKSIYKSHFSKEKTIERNFPSGFRTNVIKEKTVTSQYEFTNGETKEILLDGIKISIRNAEINPPSIVDVEHSFPFLKMHFELEGSSLYTPKNDKSVPVCIPGGYYNFFYLPEVKGTLRYDSKVRSTLEIIFTEAYLKRVFGHSFKNASSGFGEAIEKKQPFLMWQKSMPITPQLRVIIDEIINCKFKDEIKKVYLESKITEILSILFDYLKEKKNIFSGKVINEDNISKIIEAEEILRKNLKKPPNIIELSSILGINQFKLKHNFKLVFEKPIFSYLTKLRMEKAKLLILKEGYTIAEASYEVGYKNPQHFTVAFKKVFHFLPSKLKRN